MGANVPKDVVDAVVAVVDRLADGTFGEDARGERKRRSVEHVRTRVADLDLVPLPPEGHDEVTGREGRKGYWFVEAPLWTRAGKTPFSLSALVHRRRLRPPKVPYDHISVRRPASPQVHAEFRRQLLDTARRLARGDYEGLVSDGTFPNLTSEELREVMARESDWATPAEPPDDA